MTDITQSCNISSVLTSQHNSNCLHSDNSSEEFTDNAPILLQQKDPILLARSITHCPGWQCNKDGKGGSKHALFHHGLGVTCGNYVCQLCYGNHPMNPVRRDHKARWVHKVSGYTRGHCYAKKRNAREGSECFPASSTLKLQLGGKRRMDQLQVGDYVQTPKGFSRVFAFIHHLPKKTAEYVELNDRLRISDNHFLACNHRNSFRIARDVKEGDTIFVDGRADKVTSRKLVEDEGI